MPKELKAKQKSSRSAIEGGQGERRVPLGAFFFPYTFFLAKQKESILAAGAAKSPLKDTCIYSNKKSRA